MGKKTTRKQWSNLIEVLQYRSHTQPNDIAYIYLEDGHSIETKITYSELDKKVRAIAAHLKHLNLTGERALLLYPPGIDFIIAFFGCIYAGVVAVPTYPPDPTRLHRSLPRIEAILKDAQTNVALTISSLAQFINFAKGGVDSEKNTDETRALLKKISWVMTDEIQENACSPINDFACTKDTLAFLQYTSGSTSLPKGVMLTHNNLIHNLLMIYNAFEYSRETRMASWLPPYHDMGLVGSILQPLYGGFPVVLMSPIHFLIKPLNWLHAITRYKITTSGGPNFAYELCLKKITPSEKSNLDLTTWDLAFNGAESIRPETIEHFSEYFATCGFKKNAFYPCYGLAESSLLVTGGKKERIPVIKWFDKQGIENNKMVKECADSDDHSRLYIGNGHILPDETVLIIDPETKKRTDIGELWIQSPSVAIGYWNRPHDTKEIFNAFTADTGEGPFLRSGDIGFIYDEELFITGRIKELIISKGKNHYPQDIEKTVEKSHPSFRAGCCAAFSIDDVNEEKICIVQEIRDEYIKEFQFDDAVQAINREVMIEHEIEIYTIAFITPRSLLKTTSGKIQRNSNRSALVNNTLDIITQWNRDTTTEKNDITPEKDDRLSTLIAFWKEILGLVNISIDDDFFELGGQSLRALALITKINQAFNVSLPIEKFFSNNSISSIYKIINELRQNNSSVIQRADHKEYYPLSAPQKRIYISAQLDTEGILYNQPACLFMQGQIDRDKLDNAFKKLVKRHSSLRTSIVLINGEPMQKIFDHADCTIKFISAHDVFAKKINNFDDIKESDINTILKKFEKAIDYLSPPLFQCTIITITNDQSLLLANFHHIIADGSSIELIVNDLDLFYQDQEPPETIDYVDFSEWHNGLLHSEEIDKHRGFWLNQFKGEIPVLNLPTDFPRPKLLSIEGHRVYFIIEQDTVKKLEKLARESKATYFMTLMGLYALLLAKYSGQDDIVIGTPFSGRIHADLISAIGMFVNTIPMRLSPNADKTFKEFLMEIKKLSIQCLEHQTYQFENLVEDLNIKRDISRNPIFDAMFIMQNYEMAKRKIGDIELTLFNSSDATAKFDITLQCTETKNTIECFFEYSKKIFKASTIQKMIFHFMTITDQIVENPDIPIAQIRIVTEKEKRQIINEFNKPRTSHEVEKTIKRIFEEKVKQTPSKIAVEFNGKKLTYEELNKKANQLAHLLRKKGIKKDSVVGILTDRSLEMIIAILGILKAGGAYTPLDPEYPENRIQYMLKISAASLLLAQKKYFKKFAQVIDAINLDDEFIYTGDHSNLNHTDSPESLAYVIFTSGSTGIPKGVMIENHSVVSILNALQEQYPLNNNDAYLLKTTYSFDVSVTELLGWFFGNGRLVILEKNHEKDTLKILQYIKDYQITHINFVPSMLKVFLDSIDHEKALYLRSLKYIFAAGEELHVHIVKRFLELNTGIQLINIYGPTETTIYSTAYPNPAFNENTSIPIGKPLPNNKIYILDTHGTIQPIGVAGEMFIGGSSLARGYINNKELTEEKFIPNPFAPGERMYRTGDLARWLPDGNIEFLGRMDNQVKIRGYRIELGEIESALREHVGIRDAVVMAKESQEGDKRLVAYIVTNFLIGNDDIDTYYERTNANLRRSGIRIFHSAPCTVKTKDYTSYQTTIYDISKKGIALHKSDIPLTEGDEAYINFSLTGNPIPYSIKARIIFTSPAKIGFMYADEHDLGSVYLNNLKNLSREQNILIADHRRSEPRIVLVVPGEATFEDGTTVPIETIDISPRAISVVGIAEEQCKSEITLNLHLPDAGIVKCKGTIVRYTNYIAGIKITDKRNPVLHDFFEKHIKSKSLTIKELRKFLGNRLPDYMIPSLYVVIDSIPLSSNGKVDRKKLPDPDLMFDADKKYVAPRNVRETSLQKIWEEVLGVSGIGIHDNFFEVGGTSLQLVKLHSFIQMRLKVNIDIRKIYQYPTIAELAEIAAFMLMPDEDTDGSPNKGVPALLKKTAASQKDPNASFFIREKQNLISLFHNGELPSIDAAALTYIPEASLVNCMPVAGNITIKDETEPIFSGVISTSYGRIGILLLPVTAGRLIADQVEAITLINKSRYLSKIFGADTISLTGLIPSATLYGAALSVENDAERLSEISTGHATTTATVVMNIQKILSAADRNIEDECVGFLGIGSVGHATLKLMMSVLRHPKKLIIADLFSKIDFLKEIGSFVQKELGFKGELQFIPITHDVPKEFYESTLIIGATNVPDVLDINLINPGTLIVDDSGPHCFSVPDAIKRLNENNDILFTEGGKLRLPDPMELISTNDILTYFPLDIESAGPESEVRHEITGCVFSSLLSSRFGIRRDIGLVSLDACVKVYNMLKQNNITAARLQCEGYVVPQEMIMGFREGFSKEKN